MLPPSRIKTRKPRKAERKPFGESRVDHISQGGALGRVLSVGGSQAQVRLAVGAQDLRATVGKFLGIPAGNAVVIGVITKIGAQAQSREGERAVARVAMLGEIKQGERGEYSQRGVPEYPMTGDAVEIVPQRELKLIFD